MTLPGPNDARAEAPRDQSDSAFSQILRRVWTAFPSVLALVFVDADGECIDYCTSIPPFDAKVAGAHLRGTWQTVSAHVNGIRNGDVESLLLHGANRDLFVRRVNEDCTLAVLIEPDGATEALFEALEDTVRALRTEASADREAFASWPVQVEIRGAVGWPYAPGALRDAGRAIAIDAVLGRWVELGPGSARAVVCFRVRTTDGVELTLEHDALENRWARRV